MNWDWLRDFLGMESSKVSHLERLVSGLGAFVGIFSTYIISHTFLGDTPLSLLMVASMGASAVLLFAVPHGKLSQPWPVLGGHIISAIIGVTCALYIPETILALPLAAGLSVLVMHYLECIHPPGGATAVSAVLGGAAVQQLGYGYVLTPIALNAFAILLTAIIFNWPFSWRRYPLMSNKKRDMPELKTLPVGRNDLIYALEQLETVIDIEEGELERIFQLAAAHYDASQHLQASEIQVGQFYSNGRYGERWAVRQVIDEYQDSERGKDIVVYKVVAGHAKGHSGTASRGAFAVWAKQQVERHESDWKVVG